MREKTSQAVRELYRVFKRYRFTDMEGDAAFPGSCDPAPLLAEPLALLPREAFETFAWKAVTTWGNADDFRHFLPRMLELVAEERNGPPLETWQLYGKFAYAGWRDWPKTEQDAIERYAEARWFEVIHQPLILAEESGVMNPYLREWDASGQNTADDYLRAVIHLEPGLIERLLSQWSDWIDTDDTNEPVMLLAETYLILESKLMEPPEGGFLAWLQEPRRIEQLSSAWEIRQSNQLESAYLSDGHAAAERWRSRCQTN